VFLEKPVPVLFSHHRFHTDWPGSETGPAQ